MNAHVMLTVSVSGGRSSLWFCVVFGESVLVWVLLGLTVFCTGMLFVFSLAKSQVLHFLKNKITILLKISFFNMQVGLK